MVVHSVTTTRLAAGSFLFRTAHNDDLWVASQRREAEQVAVLLGRHLAPFPPGSASSSRSKAPDALKTAAVARARTFLIDCDTAILAQVPARAAGLPSPRAAEMASAHVLELPVSPSSFASAGAISSFTRAAVGGQGGAWAITAPYFQFSSGADRWLDINLDLLGETLRVAGGREVVPVIQVRTSALLDATIAAAADRYRQTGVRACLLRVAGFDGEEADIPTITAYLTAAKALQDAGLAVVADATGRFGAVAVADGATAFSAGLRAYRAVPENPIYDDEDFTSSKTLYELPNEWYGIPHDEVVKLRRAGRLPPCPIAGCDARTRVDGLRAKERCQAHMIHTFARRAAWANTVGAPAVVADLRASSAAAARRWSQALADVLAARRAAA
jgi:hypothetical protein